MATGKPKRAPAWSRPEVSDLIGLWGEETVLSQLRSSKRNLDIYGKKYQGMMEKEHQRDAYQCRVKIKELRQSYQKAGGANSRSGSQMIPRKAHLTPLQRQSLSQTIHSAMDSHRQMQETVRSTTAEVLKVLWYHSDMLGCLVDLQERRQGTVQLQPLQNAPETRVMVPSTSPATTRSHARLSRMQPLLSSNPASSHPTPGDSE